MAVFVIDYFLLLATVFLACPVYSSPIKSRSLSPNQLFKRTLYELYCPVALPDPPPAPLVHSINMRVNRADLETYGEFVLEYEDQFFEPERIYNGDQLCDRVGCRCIGAERICSIGGTRLYNAAIHAIYIDLCSARCRCEPEYREPPEPVSASDSDTDTTWSSSSVWSDDVSYTEEAIHAHWTASTAVLRAVYRKDGHIGHQVGHPPPACVPSRLQRCDNCLAGQAAGWTWKQSDCCSGYDLQQLTPQEAFTEYGLPMGDIIASHASIGICLKGG